MYAFTAAIAVSQPLYVYVYSRRWYCTKQGVALTGRNTTGPPCSRGAIVRVDAAWRHRLACAGQPPAGPPWSVTDDDRRPRPLLWV